MFISSRIFLPLYSSYTVIVQSSVWYSFTFRSFEFIMHISSSKASDYAMIPDSPGHPTLRILFTSSIHNSSPNYTGKWNIWSQILRARYNYDFDFKNIKFYLQAKSIKFWTLMWVQEVDSKYSLFLSNRQHLYTQIFLNDFPCNPKLV